MDIKNFKRQANKKRALWPIRRYMDEYYEMVLNLFPCFLLSPETVS
ncbi:Superfamily I DNA and RNA helicase and helicase subunit-like protein, partial [human gut metagenome]